MSGQPTISVVVCCYADERFEDVLACVDSLRRQVRPAAEVVVVVDYNPPLLERAAAALGDVRVVPNEGPRGLSGARNTGVATSGGEVVAFLDDDAMADPDWLERLAAAYTDAAVVGVGGAIDPAWRAGRPRWFPEEFDWVVGCTYRGLPDETTPLRNLIGANMSFRRDALEDSGGFAPELGRIGSAPVGNNEDTEISIRIRRARPGSVILYEPRARVQHTVPAARGRWGYFRVRCFAEGRAKALLTGVAGSREGLSTERAYVARALPRGVVRGVGDALRGGDPAGLARSGVIVAGLAVTTAGYVTGLARTAVPRVRRGAGRRP